MMKEAPSTNYPAGNTAADTIVHGICPAGWHVPSDAEWDTLTYYVYNSAYPDYKCSGCESSVWEQTTKCIANALSSPTGWTAPSSCGAGYSSTTLNKTGFSAVPAGGYFGNYRNFGFTAYFWSAAQPNSSFAYSRILYCSFDNVERVSNSKNYGFSVRCLKD